MLFNSIQFALFLPTVFILYWFLGKRNVKVQNIVLVFSSYFFYACWDYRFLLLLLFSTLLDYIAGIAIANVHKSKVKSLLLLVTIFLNLGFLGFFKYYNFFVNSFAEAVSALGLKADDLTLKIILPLGISFYTFHGLSYIIDIYKNRISPEKNFFNYCLFVNFFPLLVAGPIERATHLLPQIKIKREFSYANAVDGLKQILWGLFKKIIIADTCAEYVNTIFANYSSYSGSTLVLGAILFAFQIYCDFSAYSDIAIGTAKLFGINLLRNFAFPYFSRDIAEFWRRWHISLTTWFRDYVYIPIGGSRGTLWNQIRNTFIIFLISGFWHGANWTFIIWGALNAIYFLPLLLLHKNRTNLEIVAQGKIFPTFKEVLSMGMTFSLVVFAWIFFRAPSVSQAMGYISGIWSISLFTIPKIVSLKDYLFILIFLIIEWLGREQQYAIAYLNIKLSRPTRWAFYYAIIFTIIIFAGKEQQFIYFQF